MESYDACNKKLVPTSYPMADSIIIITERQTYEKGKLLIEDLFYV